MNRYGKFCCVVLLFVRFIAVSFATDSASPTRLDFCPAPCGLPLVDLGGKEYYIHSSSKVNWFEAYTICEANGMKLLSIETSMENNFITRGVADHRSSETYWISANDLNNEGVFMWRSTNQRVTFTNWAPTEPQNYNGGEHCVIIGQGEENQPIVWRDAPCAWKKFFICEKP